MSWGWKVMRVFHLEKGRQKVQENVCQAKRTACTKAGSLKRPFCLHIRTNLLVALEPGGEQGARRPKCQLGLMRPRSLRKHKDPIMLVSGFRFRGYRPHVTPNPCGHCWAPERGRRWGGDSEGQVPHSRPTFCLNSSAFDSLRMSFHERFPF